MSRPFAKWSEVKPGTRLVADGGFVTHIFADDGSEFGEAEMAPLVARVLNDMPNKSASFETLFEKLREVVPDYVRNPKVESFATCMSEGEIKIVRRDPDNGCLYIPCRRGRHYLDGQLKNGRLIGLYFP